MPLVTNTEELTSKSFDYIVVGAGTAGLALAARLTEDEKVNVLVLEAGGRHHGDPAIDIPAQYGATFMNPKYDWAFKTVKQKHANDKEHVWARGKGLGGSSNMNFFCWIKPPAQDIDAFETLGNPGWNWADYEKYSKKSETFTPAIPEIAEKYPHSYNEKFRGTSGPIQVTVPLHAHTLDVLVQDTLANKGIRRVEDPYGGDMTGTFIAANNMDPKTWTRSYSATGYWEPNQDRPNFYVLSEAYVTRIAWADEKDSEGNLVVSGVEFVHNGATKVVNASKEVILSAGTIKTPQILELSGVGRPDVLSKVDVPVKLELPGVGENVQEHHFMWVVFELDATKAEHQTFDLMFEPGYAQESLRLHSEGKGLHRMGMTTFAFLPVTSRDHKASTALIDELEANLKKQIEKGEISPALAKQYELQLKVLRDDNVPDMEFIVFPGYFMAPESQGPGRRFVTLICALNHPISRGYIHVKNNNPLDDPEIDANYFGNNFDLKVLLEHVKFTRSLLDTEPFKSNIIGEVLPGPSCATDEQVEEYIKNTHMTTFHSVGSCSMLPREDGGVVDPKLKVYGTSNLRVADLSIVPLHVAAHMQATAYVIGEKAADLIKADA